jgi:hypothetical protein
MPDRYPAIEDHAVVGDLHTVALVATDGTTAPGTKGATGK